MLKLTNILISGGGTGGHIFPAVAIANGIRAILPDVNILFVGAKGRMEMEKVPQAGYPIEGLWISGLQRKLDLKNLSFPFKVLSSLIKANKIINKFKPDVVIGTGGYASGPLLYVASKKKVPTLILEQNSYPGITNKLLGKSVSKVCVSYDGMEKYFPKKKIIITGSPIRKEINELKVTREESIEYFNLNRDKTTLLIIGGSQAAKLMEIRNETIKQCLSDFQNIAHRLEYAGSVHGISFINDSKATNVNSTWYALESIEKPIIWIAGGIDKGNDYNFIKSLVKEKVKAIVCLGVDNKKLHDEFGDDVELIVDTKSASEAVQAAYQIAQKGETVLLSPACASFDLFENYEDRGNQFKKAVNNL